MRLVLTAAAFATAFAFTAAKAEPTFDAPGPIKQGNLCKVDTSGGENMYGYLAPCAPEAQAQVSRKKRKS